MSFANRPRVTPHEFVGHVLPALSNDGLSQHQLEQFKLIVHDHFVANPHMPSLTPGMDQHDVDTLIAYGKAHSAGSAIGEHGWEKIGNRLTEYVQKRT